VQRARIGVGSWGCSRGAVLNERMRRRQALRESKCKKAKFGVSNLIFFIRKATELTAAIGTNS